jgi:uncharacterized protein YozE (UPF0346 family)
MTPKRYYIHGDTYEIVPNQYYCALCDSFEFKEHFFSDTFHKTNNQEKYTTSLEQFRKANKPFLKRNLRSPKVFNLFYNLPKKEYSKFYRWLLKQKDRNDPIGDLANDALSDKSFPINSDSFVNIKKHLNFKGACYEAIQALTEAFKEYKKKNPKRSTISLKLRFEIFKADNYKCSVCGASAKDEGVQLEVDHKIAKADGGSDDKSNLWTLCFKCNRGKGKSKL